MGNILGIDWGRAKVGLAWSAGKLSEPLEVIRFNDREVLFNKLREIVKDMEIKKIVVGISEGRSAIETREFGKAIEEALQMPVTFFDETLSSRDAQMYSQAAGIKRSKRKKLEDAYAASLMLQMYVDLNL
jgi:putative holliday junction resolvase